jgi:hypothetical protein
MSQRSFYHNVIIALAVLLTGCRASLPDPHTTTLVVPTATVTATHSPTEQFSTRMPPATPGLDVTLVNDILFKGTSPECKLPCWEGLEIGTSGPEDIQRVMDTEFGFNGSVDFINDSPLSRGLYVDLPGFESTGNSWVIDNYTGVMTLKFVSSNNTLRGISFLVQSPESYRPYTINEIIRNLGVPHFMVGTIEEGLNGDILIELRFAYQDGLIFYYGRPLAPTETTYCVDQPPVSAQYAIVERFESVSAEDATPLQQEWFFKFVTERSLKPISEVFGVTEQEFSAISLSDNPCFEVSTQ